MTTLKMTLLSTAAMTTAERKMGRFMRAPDGHGEGGDTGGAAATSADGDGAGTPEPTALEKLEAEFADDGDDAADDGDDDDGEDLGSSSTGEEEGDDGDDGDSEGGEGDAEKPNRTQERINELTAARREAERQAAENLREAEKWKRIAEQNALPPEPEVQEGAADPNAAPNPDDFEYGLADPKYIAALAKHEVMIEIRQQNEQARTQQTLHELEAKYQTGLGAALERYPDYDEVVTKGAEEKKWACSPIFSLGIRDSEVGHDIAYHLAKNPDESKRIAALDNMLQAREFGRLEGRFLSEREAKTKSAEQQQQAAPAPKRTAAPPPPKAQTRGRGGNFKVSADTDDFAAFDKAYGN